MKDRPSRSGLFLLFTSNFGDVVGRVTPFNELIQRSHLFEKLFHDGFGVYIKPLPKESKVHDDIALRHFDERFLSGSNAVTRAFCVGVTDQDHGIIGNQDQFMGPMLFKLGFGYSITEN